jgi:hypothetical protein
MLKRIAFIAIVCLFSIVSGFSQASTPAPPMLGGVPGWVAVGATQQVKQVTFTLVAPGVFAVANAAQPTIEYNACMSATPPPSGIPNQCQLNFSNAIQADINTRWQNVLRGFYQGLPSGTNADQLLAANQIYVQLQ